MKKRVLYSCLGLFLFAAFTVAQDIEPQKSFSESIKNCEKYSNLGSASYENQVYSIAVSLEKGRANKCVYKEKIYQDKKYELLTCNFDKSLLPDISTSMANYYSRYKKQIDKNKIFEAKMTSNMEMLQKYLTNPAYCTITYSKN